MIRACRPVNFKTRISPVILIPTRKYHFELLNLKIGFTKKVDVHPESDKLYVSNVDLGQHEAMKQVCSGLRQYMSPDKLQDQLVVVVDNMKKCKLRGQLSEGMLLCGEDTLRDEVKICTPSVLDASLVGKNVVLESSEPLRTPTTRRIKTKEWEDISSRLRVGQEGKIMYTEEEGKVEKPLCVYNEKGVPVPIVATGLPAGSIVK